MKDLKKALKKVAAELAKAAKTVEKVADQLDNKPASKVAKKTSAKQPTAIDTVYSIIKRYKNGAHVSTIKKRTGYDDKKIHNIVYKLKKQGMIKSEAKGVYIKA